MSSPVPTPQGPAPFLTIHTAVVLLISVVIGLIVGGLTFLSGGAVAAAVLAGPPKGLVACVIRLCPENAKTGRQGRAMREN
ncbi:hypothetical protein [Streptomyces ardesiacus]|uniref:hypothetical protein n=1 Tax=Streptomyces ardesiacus TaxID=285564 RepID=UPI0006E32979|nr:hypothetical protein [Streptomyces sp. NBRC 110030]